MIDRYLNEILPEKLSNSQKDMLERLMEQPYETPNDKVEQYKKMMVMETKNGYPARAFHRPNYTSPSNIDKKKRKSKTKQQKQSRCKNRR